MDEVVAVLASLQPDQDRKAVLEQVRPALSRLTRQQMQLGIQQVKQLPILASSMLALSARSDA